MGDYNAVISKFTTGAKNSDYNSPQRNDVKAQFAIVAWVGGSLD